MFYELTTNACKHGCLRCPSTNAQTLIRLSWHAERTKDATKVELHWREARVKAGSHGMAGGFGSDLIKEAIPRMLGGTDELSIADEVVCVARFVQENEVFLA